MKRSFGMLFFAAALAAAPLAVSANSIVGADGVARFAYGGRTTPTVDCAPFYVCDLTLEAGESIENVAIGDSVRWILSPATSGNGGDTPHILVKPTDVGLQTNLVVTTNRRSYYVNLRSVKANPMLRVGFFYPQNLAAAFATPAPSPSPTPAPSAAPTPASVVAADLDLNYVATGESKILPAHAFNDGVHTYLQFARLLPHMPVVLEVGPTGDQLINYRVKDQTTYIIDGLPDKVALQVGAGKGSQRATIWRKS